MPSGVVAASALVELTYLGSDLDPAADPSALLAVLSSGGGSTLTPVTNRTASSLTTAIAGAPTGTLALGMPGADLAVLIAGPTALVVGTSGSFHVSVSNSGPFEAPSVVVEIVLPPAAALAAAAVSQGSCVTTQSGLSCALGSLASGENASVDLLVSFDAAGTHLLEASVSLPSGAVDPDAAGDTTAMSVVVTAREEPPPPPSPSPSPGSSPRPGGTGELPDTAGAPGGLAISLVACLAFAGLLLAVVAGRRSASSRR